MKKPETSCLLSTYWKVLGSCILQDCICFMVKSIFIGQQLSQLVPSPTFFCENTETLARLSFPLTHRPVTHTPPAHTPHPPPEHRCLCSQRMFTMSSFFLFFFLSVRKFRALLPPHHPLFLLCSRSLQEFV